MSKEAIPAGTRWANEVAGELEASDFGIICVSRSNLDSPWLNFEAGALGKKLDHARVCPYLIDLEPTDIDGPLTQFQMVPVTIEGTSDLVRSLNAAGDQIDE